MDRPTSSSMRNRGQRPIILGNSTNVELRGISPSGIPAAESVDNGNIPDGHVELRRQLPSQFRTRNSTENDQDDDSSIYDTGSDVTVVTRSLRTWDVAALIINKMVRFQKLSYHRIVTKRLNAENKQIGTGIFTTPGVVLSLTGSKSISIILWVVGGVHTFLWWV
jgi:hypothetical protein